MSFGEPVKDPNREPMSAVDNRLPPLRAAQRLLYCLNLITPDFGSVVVDRLTQEELATDIPAGMRAWFRYRFPDEVLLSLPSGATGDALQRHAYVSLDPPEFRINPPAGENIVIVEVGALDRDPRLLQLLEMMATIHDHEGVSQRYRYWTRCAANLYQARTQEPLEEFWARAMHLAADRSLDTPQILSTLYDEFFAPFRLTGCSFAPAIALVQICSPVGEWLHGQHFRDAQTALSCYIHWCSYEFPAIPVAAAGVGNTAYDRGNECLRHALNAFTLDSFYFFLYQACHQFLVARLTIEKLEGLGSRSPVHLLEFDAVRAEEGFANASTALSIDLESYLEGNLPAPELKWKRLIAKGDIEAVEQEAYKYSRPTNPVWPRHYTRASLAIAKARAGRPWVNDGLEELIGLKQEFDDWAQSEDGYAWHAASSVEYDRLLAGLVVGYSNAGYQSEAETTASHLAGRRMVRSAFE